MTAIILVEPQMGENIGAAARVMYNFGFDDLRVVNPRDGWQGTQVYDKAHEMSAHADWIIEKAKLFDSVEAAIADLEYVYAASARPRDMTKEVIAPREIELKGKTGFMFGRESNGLTNEQIMLANKIITIPVNPEYSSINISMSVGIICYEASQQSLQKPEFEMATKADIDALIKHFETELDKTEFFTVPRKKPGMMLNFSNIFTRSSLTAQEVRTLRGVVKALTAGQNSGGG